MKFDDFRAQVVNEIRTYLGRSLPPWFDADIRWYFDLGNTVGWTARAGVGTRVESELRRLLYVPGALDCQRPSQAVVIYDPAAAARADGCITPARTPELFEMILSPDPCWPGDSFLVR